MSATRTQDDQTPGAWKALAATGALGTGVFLERINPVFKRFVSSITYDQFLQQATEAIARQWVPHSVAAEFMVRNAPSGAKCNEYTLCPPGCICVDGYCR